MILGKQSISFENPPYILSCGSIVGKKEGEGPLGNLFDKVEEDNLLGQDTWEEAEREFLYGAVVDNCLYETRMN